MCLMDDQNPISGLIPRSIFLDQTIPASIRTGPSALAMFDYPHDSWKEAADEGGHAGSDAAIAEVIRRLEDVLPATCALAALGYMTFATMISGPRFSDHRKVVVKAVTHVNAQVIDWKGIKLGAPRIVAALVMAQAHDTVTPAGLVYEAARLVFGPAVVWQPDRVEAWIHRDGNWHPFDQRPNP